MDRPRSPRDTAARWRDDLREFFLCLVAAIGAVTVVGTLIQPTIRVGSIDSWFDDTQRSPTTPLLLAIAAVVLLGVPISIYLIEHRRPWPFGPRDPDPSGPPRLEYVLSYLVGWATVAVTADTWPATRLYDLDDGRFLWAIIPAASAAQIVAVGAAYAISRILLHLLLGRIRVLLRHVRGVRHSLSPAMTAPDSEDRRAARPRAPGKVR